MTIYLGYFNSEKAKEAEHPLLHEPHNHYFDGFDIRDKNLREEIKNLDIIVAIYEYGNFEGKAFVLYKKDGKLFEVNDYHCSCNGLSIWDPEETSKEALLKRPWESLLNDGDKVRLAIESI
ncbi:MAG: hypothetical protein KGJ07_00130 [Patescibacteria group bacterium]|nr:hypothetical protein [Patescibacteria group bacterium]